MKNRKASSFVNTICLLLLIWVVLPEFAISRQHIDLDAINPVHVFDFEVNQPAADVPIGVQGAGGINVFWMFSCDGTVENGIPTGVTDSISGPMGSVSSFTTIHGITITLPSGAPDDAVSHGDVTILSVAGGPVQAGAFQFCLTATLEDGTKTQSRVYEVDIISPPLDLVFVLDRSGSMNISTTAGMTRWQALTASVASFLNIHQNLNRPPGDRVSITYFSTDIEPLSGCCSDFVPVNSTTINQVNNELNGINPSGWTAMGMGLQDAETKLNDISGSDRLKSILLITDGQQNRNPRVKVSGDGYENLPGNIHLADIPGINDDNHIRIFTIWIGGPGTMNTTLQNLDIHTGASYHSTLDGADLADHFADALSIMLEESSPQLISRTRTNIAAGNAPHTLQSFPLNNRVDRLLLEFEFDRRFEGPELLRMLSFLQVLKDDADVTGFARPSWVGNYTNTLLLTYQFTDSGEFFSPERYTTAMRQLSSAGDWTIRMADVSNLRISGVKLTSIADDHRLRIRRHFGNPAPRVDESFPVNISLSWMGMAIEDADIEALILKPGTDLGNLLADYPFTADLSADDDAGLPGIQKFEELWLNDPDFRSNLQRSDNIISLTHTSDGNYEASFNDLDVTGAYGIVIRISADSPDTGPFRRMISESFYTSFSEVDMVQSGVTTQTTNDKQLIMHFRPVTNKGLFIGPAMSDAFRINDPDIEISEVIDHQDGSYTITFTGDINKQVSLELLGREIYTGRLDRAGASDIDLDRIIDIIRDFIALIGLPMWAFWFILFLLIVILWFILRRK